MYYFQNSLQGHLRIDVRVFAASIVMNNHLSPCGTVIVYKTASELGQKTWP
jgi:hypothetical protein